MTDENELVENTIDSLKEPTRRIVNIKPVREYVLIEKLEKESFTSEGGIILQPNSIDIFDRAVIVEVSDGFYQNGTWCKLRYEVGQIVLVPEKQGESIFIDGKEYFLLRENSIWGIITVEVWLKAPHSLDSDKEL